MQRLPLSYRDTRTRIRVCGGEISNFKAGARDWPEVRPAPCGQLRKFRQLTLSTRC